MKLRMPESSSGNKLWDVMNDLQMVTSKIVSAREVIDSVAEAIQKNDYSKAETLAMAAYEFLGYYLDEFDDKFQLAWNETVVKAKKHEESLHYTDEELNAMCDAAEQQHNKKSWQIVVEEAYNKDGESIFSYIQLPDEVVEHMGLNQSSFLHWIDNEDGTVTIKKS